MLLLRINQIMYQFPHLAAVMCQLLRDSIFFPSDQIRVATHRGGSQDDFIKIKINP